jgi:predicted esterase YcpF (UPF0227 family)
MKTLYIHGMGGRPWPEGIARLQSFGLEVFALHLQYNHQSFNILRDFIQENKIEFLVGHSHGGFMGFWLAEELGLPCLLTNPSLSLSAKKRVSPVVSQLACPLCLVVLGGKDELVNPNRTLQYFEADARPDKITKIKFLENEEHRLPLAVFSEVVEWALKELKEFKGANN